MKKIRKQQSFYFAHKDIRKICNKKHVMLFLDFDGTLAEIVDHYKSAKILAESKGLLKKIAKMHDCSLAIISGRALSDVKRRVGIKRITYAGNHGLEIDGPGVKYTYFVKTENRIRFKIVKGALISCIKNFEGVLVEDKGLTLSVHYRKIKSADWIPFKRVITDCLIPYLINKEITFSAGKKIFEIKPNVKWDKGKAILWLISQFKRKNAGKRILPIFIGDDVTDETAFKALKGKGLCIRVGKEDGSSAPYFLKDIKQVTRFLKMVVDAKDDQRGV